MRLDNHGKIAVADIVFYAPTVVVAVYLMVKHGYRVPLGWLFLFLLSIIRLVFGILVVVMQSQKRPTLGIFIAASILASVGLTLLLMASLGFLRTVASNGFSDKRRLPRFLNRTQLILVVSIALSIAGGSMRVPTNKLSTQAEGSKLVKAGAIIATVMFASLVGLTVFFWVHRTRHTASRAILLKAFTLAIPFLIVRIVYAVHGAFASTIFSKWSPLKGSWRAFLVMGLLMEFIVVLIYVTAGIMIPRSKDERDPDDAEEVENP